MRNAIPTYCFLLFCATGFAQGHQLPCSVGGDNPDKQLSICEQVECYYQHQLYLDALAAIQQNPKLTCNTKNQVLAIVGSLNANKKFNESFKVLHALKKGILTPEQISNAEAKTMKIKMLSQVQSGAYLRNSVQLNTKYNDLIAFRRDDGVVQIIDKPYTKSYFPHVATIEGKFHFINDSLAALYIGNSFLTWQNYTNFSAGTRFNDSLIFLSAVPNSPYGGNDGAGSFEIICVNPDTRDRIPSLSLSLKKASALHPTFADSTLIFSSNMAGGYGGMDLYSADFSTEGFTNIKNLGAELNSEFDEIFPTAIGDTLYFTSNRTDMGFGGLDIYKVALSGGIPQNAGVPINTAYDDLGPMADGKTVKYLLSNRAGGAGGVDIYTVHWAPTRIFFQQLKGKIQAEGIDLTSVVIEIRSSDGSIAQKTTADKNGFFTFPNVKGMESYEIFVADTKLSEGATLSLYGDDGGVIKKVAMNEEGSFKFELLAPEDYFLKYKANPDQSVLAVDILGMLESDQSEPGFKIYLQDSEGELVGVATTDEYGNFAFKSVKPDANYVIRSEVVDPNAIIRIVNKAGKTIKSIKPKSNGEFVYVRLSANARVITLTNEAEQKVKISENELFNIPVLYFGVNDTRLNQESKVTLDKLVVLLKNNPEVSLELAGHTDSRGSNTYNLQLSQARIDAVIDYLALKGIPTQNLIGKGYGETQLLNECGDGVKCTEKEHAVNRRTEIRIFKNRKP